ncbi:tRNA (adenosine(37)-N6)-dimethylallyltransferase MiaA [Sphingomonas sp. RHCKR47]|nr:tRNA (adenosine(37)-N6)-dimethylallyltransferase MiaA [Sphingomonas citricola]
MQSPSPHPRVALIAGPTASGKSAMAIELAERIGGTVINADASQVYRDLRVLSARPSTADEARVPHRLFGYVDGAEACSAARWARDATAAIDAVHARGGVPVLVGGTGLYLRTLLDGIAPVPEIDVDIRAAVRALPVADAYAALAREDPSAAARLAPADTTRVARALEVVRSTGHPLSHWQRQHAGGIGARITLSAAVLVPDREELLARCDRRLEAMFDEGAVQEVAALTRRDDVPADAPVLRAIGVPEIAAMLAGSLDRDEAISRAQLSTRQYAKRQFTWFRNQPPPTWQRMERLDPQFYFLQDG